MEAPSSKVTTSAAAGAVVTLLLFLFGSKVPDLGADQAAGIVTVLAFILSYLKPENRPASSSKV